MNWYFTICGLIVLVAAILDGIALKRMHRELKELRMDHGTQNTTIRRLVDCIEMLNARCNVITEHSNIAANRLGIKSLPPHN